MLASRLLNRHLSRLRLYLTKTSYQLRLLAGLVTWFLFPLTSFISGQEDEASRKVGCTIR